MNNANFYVDDVSVVDGTGQPLSVGVANPDDAESPGAWESGGEPGFVRVTADSA